MTNYFSFVAFRIFSLSFDFDTWHCTVSQCGFLWVHSSWSLWSSLNMNIHFFYQVWNVFSHSFFVFLFLATLCIMRELPRPGIEPVPPAVEAQTRNHWALREVPSASISSNVFLPPLFSFRDPMIVCSCTWQCSTGTSGSTRFSSFCSFDWILWIVLSSSYVAELVKNPPAMWETWVRSLGWDDPPEKGKATHSSILAWKIPRTM